MASAPLLAETTRYPLVESINVSTESSCSLSTTQRMIFLGRMMMGHTPLIDFICLFFVRSGCAGTHQGCSAAVRMVQVQMSYRRTHAGASSGSDSCPGKWG